MSTSTEYMDGLNTPAERRFYPRVAPPSPIWVAFGPNNLGVLQDLSENGFQITTPSSLALNSVYRVIIPLKPSKKTIVVTVRTIWTNDDENRSGIQLLDLSDEDRKNVRELVDSELARYEAQAPEPEVAPIETQESASTSRSFPAPVQDSEAGYVPSWPAEWQREDWQHIDVEHAPGAAASNFETNAPQFAEARGLAAETKFEEQPQYAAPKDFDEIAAEDEDVEAFKTEGFAPASSNAVDVNDREASQEASVHSRMEPPAAVPVESFLGMWAQQPPLRAKPHSPRSVAEPENRIWESAAPQGRLAAEPTLPPIANPFDQPSPNSNFPQFPPVPLPIHGEFEYAPSSSRRRRATLSSRMRVKSLLAWAAVLALVCLGANALVRYKLSQNARHFATDATKATSPVASSSTDTGTSTQSPADSQVAMNSSADTNSSDQSSVTPPQQLLARNSNAPRPPARQGPSLDGENSAYSATAPSSAVGSAPTSQPATRTWSAPAPNRSSSTAIAANDSPQTPNVTSSNTNDQAASIPSVVQTRPTPPVDQTTSTHSAASNAVPASNSNSSVSNPPAGAPQPSNSQASSSQGTTYASNAAAPPSRSQSQIYNANAPAQRSAIIGSINSVHSSGIFDSNDSTRASVQPATSTPAPASYGNSSVAPHPAANASVVPTDVPQDRDLEITAPKGFTASWVDLPGEHVVRSSAGTVHIHRLIRVPGERVPGQRWLWRSKLNITLGDVVNRIDPAAVQQASGGSGSLTVLASIDKDGYVTDLKPLNGNFALLPSVSRTVRNWHYQPTYLDSKRTETQAQIEFELRPTATATRATQR